MGEFNIVDVGSLDFANITEDNISQEGDVLFDDLDGELADLGIDLSALTGALKTAPPGVARNVAAANRDRLEKFGQKVAGDAIFSASSVLPDWARNHLLPDYPPPKPTPAWVKSITDPLLFPVLMGAKKQALQVANRVKVPMYATLGITFLTILGGGFILGRVTARRR